MADFLITQFVMYPWLAWVLSVFTVMSLVFWFLLGLAGAKAMLDWAEMRREDQRILADILARAHAGDDPPEYEPDEEPGEDWPGDETCLSHPEPDDNGDVVAAWFRALKASGALDDDVLPDEIVRCTNRDCDLYGVLHNGPCILAPTMPAKCYTDPDGPAGPPVPWSSMAVSMPLLPAIRADLEAAGHTPHEYIEDVAESSFTAGMAREVRELEK